MTAMNGRCDSDRFSGRYRLERGWSAGFSPLQHSDWRPRAKISGVLAFACGSCVRAARRRPSNRTPRLAARA